MKFPALTADTFASNIFQSTDEIAPVVVDEASTSESCCPESESPLGFTIVTASCDCAWSRATWDSRIEILPERVERFALVVARDPERLAISIVLFAIFVVLLCTCHERVFISLVFWVTIPESEVRFVFVVASAPERILKLLVTSVVRFEREPERVFTLFEILMTVVVRFERDPERFTISIVFTAIPIVLFCTCHDRELTVAERVASDPETVAIILLILFTAPERVERLALAFARDPERVFILLIFCTTMPESEARLTFVVERTQERLFTILERLVRLPETVVIWEFRVDIVPERAFCARVSVK
jgi:hypothetical protein